MAAVLLFGILFNPLIVSSIGLFMLLVLFMWMFPLHMLSLVGIFYGIWYTAGQLKALLESKDANYMIFSNTFFMLFIVPIGVLLIQPGVNQLYHDSQQSENTDDDA